MISKYLPPKVIAEIGCNHKGDIGIAKELLKIAAQSGVEVAKFQKRNNKELLTKYQYNAPHPNPMHSYGKTYGAHREFLEFNFTSTSRREPDINSKFVFSILILVNKLLVSAFILLEIKSI